jgi:hypothetical protein
MKKQWREIAVAALLIGKLCTRLALSHSFPSQRKVHTHDDAAHAAAAANRISIGGPYCAVIFKGDVSPTPREVLACSDLSNNAVCTQNTLYRLRAWSSGHCRARSERDASPWQQSLLLHHPSAPLSPPSQRRQIHRMLSRSWQLYEAAWWKESLMCWKGGEQFCHLDARAA